MIQKKVPAKAVRVEKTPNNEGLARIILCLIVSPSASPRPFRHAQTKETPALCIAHHLIWLTLVIPSTTLPWTWLLGVEVLLLWILLHRR